MDKKVVIVEPLFALVEVFAKIAHLEGDEIYFMASPNKLRTDSTILECDIRYEHDKAVNLIRQYVGTPDAIFTTGEIYLTQTARLCETFDLPHNPKESIYINRDKSKMKKVWNDNRVATPDSKFYTSAEALNLDKHKIKYPVIIKPSMGYASFGVKKVENELELFEQLQKIFLLNFSVVSKEKVSNMGFLVEEYIDGKEYSIDTIWFDGKPIVSGIMSKGMPIGPCFPDRLYCVEPDLSEDYQNKIREISYRAVMATGIIKGATHTEIRFKKDMPFVIESTCRPGAGGFFYTVFREAYGIDFYKILYCTYICRTVKEFNNYNNIYSREIMKKNVAFFYNIPFPDKGVIKEIKGLDEMCKRKELVQYICFKKEGDILYEEDMSSDYLLWIIGKLGTKQYRYKLKEALNFYDHCLRIVVA